MSTLANSFQATDGSAFRAKIQIQCAASKAKSFFELELRTTLGPYDDHDDTIDATQARLTPAQRACQESRGDDFVAALRSDAGVEPTELTDPKPR
jgi:hypothetical protein